MAITILKSPPAYVPSSSPAYWTASSNQVAQPNFKYRVIITDVITSASQSKDVDQRFSDSKLVVDSNAFAELYTVPYIPNNVYGFQKCTNSIRQVKVNIGEVYGTTPTYYAGSDQFYIVWNGVLLDFEIPGYAMTDYLYKSSTSNWKFISSYDYAGFTPRYKLNNRAYADKSSFIYNLSTEADDFEAIGIKCYDANGSLIQQSRIVNPYSGTTTYTDKYVCIDVGRKGLDNISSGLVQLSYPIIPSNCDYYEIEDIGISGDEPPFTYTTRKIIQRLYISCESKCEVWTAHYWSKRGNFETVHFPKVSKRRNSSNKTTFNQNPYDLTAGNEYTFTNFQQTQKVLNSAVENRIDLQSDWMSYEEIAAHAEIIDAPLVYLDFGSTIGLRPCEVETNSYEDKRKFNTGDPAFAITVKLGGTNSKQRG